MYLLYLCILCVSFGVSFACPSGCTCTVIREKEVEIGKKVICKAGNNAIFSTLLQEEWPPNTRVLDLSENKISSLRNGSFRGLNSLTKLDLSQNEISRIEPGAFLGLSQLTKLDLSDNQLSAVNGSMFQGLSSLQRLELGGNLLRSLPESTVTALPALHKLDFGSAVLVCDCRLAWVVRWSRGDADRRVPGATKCALPSELKGAAVRGLRRRDLHCDHESVELAVFELSPSADQVVFAGDRLPLSCRASDPGDLLAPAGLFWLRPPAPGGGGDEGEGEVVNGTQPGVTVTTNTDTDTNTVTSVVVVASLSPRDTGSWRCVVATERGNVSQAVRVTVMDDTAPYCSAGATRTNKGLFHWGRAVAGTQPSVPCPHGAAAVHFSQTAASASSPVSGGAVATRRCDDAGVWQDVEDGACQYAAEVTRVLQQYAKTDLSNMTTLASWAGKLRSYVADSGHRAMQDVMDVVYVADVMTTLAGQLANNPGLGEEMLKIGSIVMETKPSILKAAEEEPYSACSRIVSALERLPQQVSSSQPALSSAGAHIAMAAMLAPTDTDTGLTCGIYYPEDGQKEGGDDAPFDDSSLMCAPVVPRNGSQPTVPGKYMAGSIHLPPGVLSSAAVSSPLVAPGNNHSVAAVGDTVIASFWVYRHAALFPLTDGDGTEEIRSPVIAARLSGGGVRSVNLSAPAVLRLQGGGGVGPARAVWWDGAGWQRDGGGGCSVSELAASPGGLVTVTCSRLTHTALLTTVAGARPGPDVVLPWQWGRLTMSPIVYAGSAILAACALATSLTYIIANRRLTLPRKLRHAVPNLAVSVLLLTAAYTLGARSPPPPHGLPGGGGVIACQVIGITLHYLSLTSLFWITIIAYVMYKKFMKAARPPAPRPEYEDPAPPPRPVLGVYLLGWGLAVIVVGIVAAISLNHYSPATDGDQFCFVSRGPRLLALYAPAGGLVLACAALFSCTCRVLTTAGPGATSDPEPDTEEVNVHDIEADEGESILGADQSITPCPPSTTVLPPAPRPPAPRDPAVHGSVMDLALAPVSYLRGAAMTLLLYLVTWTAGALVLAVPGAAAFPHAQLLYDCVYAVAAASLGLYMLAFYVLARHDARQGCCGRREEKLTAAAAVGPPRHHHGNGHVRAPSVSSMESHGYSNRSHGAHSNGGLRYPAVGAALESGAHTDTSGLSLGAGADLHAFYNPKQNGLARKYWERRRQKSLLTQHLAGGRSGGESEGSNPPPPRSAEYPAVYQLPRPRPGVSSPASSDLMPPADGQSHRSQSPGVQPPPPHGYGVYSHGYTPPIGHIPASLGYSSSVAGYNTPPAAGSSVYTNGYCTPPPPMVTPPYLLPHAASHTLPRPPGHMTSHMTPPAGHMTLQNGRVRRASGGSQPRGDHSGSERPVSRGGKTPPPPLPPRNTEPAPEPRRASLTDLASSVQDSGTEGPSLSPGQSFLHQLQQRIPNGGGGGEERPHNGLQNGGVEMRLQNGWVSSPEASESHQLLGNGNDRLVPAAGAGGEFNNNQQRPMRSQNGDAAAVSNHKPSSGSKHKAAAAAGKPKPKDWEKEFADRPAAKSTPLAYAFVNHNYQDKVISRLLQKQVSEPEGTSPPPGDGLPTWLLPRSVSAYEQVSTNDYDSEDSTSTDTDVESASDVWHGKKRSRLKSKKETSV